MQGNRSGAVVVLVLLLAPAATGADWPWWRGPHGTGVSSEKDLPVSWGPQAIAWTAPLGGTGVSSPVVWGERVFVTSQAGAGARRPGNHPTLSREAAPGTEKPIPAAAGDGVTFLVEAFDRASGRRLWQHRLAADGPLPPVHEKHNLASPSPVTDGESVFAWFGTGQVVALSTDGRPLWQRHLGREVGPFEINWGHGSSPALHGDLLYLLCYHEAASYLLAVDKGTGRTRWKVDRPRDTKSYSTPVVIAGPRGPELVVNSTEGIHAYDPASGAPLWRAGGTHNFAIPVPTHEDGVLYASRGYRSGPYLALRPGGRGDVGATHVKWSVATGAPYISSILVYHGVLYMASDNGIVTAVDPASGEKLWQERTGGVFSASPVAGDGKVYFASETGETLVVRAGREPRILARNRVDARLVASPAIAGGRIFLRADDRLIAVGR